MIDVDKLLFMAYEGRMLSANAIRFVNLKVRQLLVKEPNNLLLQGGFIVVGDLHG